MAMLEIEKSELPQSKYPALLALAALALTLAFAASSGCSFRTSGRVKPDSRVVAGADFVTKGSDGFHPVPASAVTSARISVIANKIDSATRERVISGASLARLLKDGGLGSPREETSIAASRTGRITLIYKNPETGLAERRSFEILDARYIQDVAFPEVIYDARVPLTKSWMLRL